MSDPILIARRTSIKLARELFVSLPLFSTEFDSHPAKLRLRCKTWSMHSRLSEPIVFAPSPRSSLSRRQRLVWPLTSYSCDSDHLNDENKMRE